MNSRKVSIITPLYNSEPYIAATIDSVLNQSYKDFEMIIIDDHSQDNSVAIVKSYADRRIRLICLTENKGAGIARNKGIEEAEGRYIAFLDADDLWLPYKLEKQINFMKSRKVAFCFSSFYLIDANGDCLNKYRQALPRVDYHQMLKNNYIGCLTAIYDTGILGKIYMSEHKKRQDWGLWLEILSKTKWAESIQEPLAYYRLGNQSLSHSKWSLIKPNYLFYRDQVGLSVLGAMTRILLFIFYYFHYRIKYTRAK